MKINSDFSTPISGMEPSPHSKAAPSSPEDLLRSLKEHRRLYQILTETGLIHKAKARSIQEELKTAITDLEQIIQNFKDGEKNV